MHEKFEAAARRVAENMLLLAMSRIVMVVLVPIVLAVGGWIVKDLVAMDRRVTVLEEHKPEVARRIESVERQRQRDVEDVARMSGRFSSIEAALATLAAQQGATLRSVERIERVLDSERGR
jgi:hypothetical protein